MDSKPLFEAFLVQLIYENFDKGTISGTDLVMIGAHLVFLLAAFWVIGLSLPLQ